jgi:hypothetical protein
MPTSPYSSRSSLGMNRGQAFSSLHVDASSVIGAASTGALLGSHGAGVEMLPNTLKRHTIRFHIGPLSELCGRLSQARVRPMLDALGVVYEDRA